jgi:hypothetical protein
MKKIILSIAIGSVLTLTTPSYADEQKPISVYVDGQQINFEVPPTIQDGTTLVPIRAIFEKLGLTVGWDGITKTVIGTKSNLNIQMKIGNTNATVNGKVVALEVPPNIINGNTLIPLRFVGESCNKDIAWDGNNRRIDIKTKGKVIDVNVREVTRAEVSRFLVRSLGLYDAQAQANLTDVSLDNPYYKDIASAISSKVMLGYEDGSFKPENAVSRIEYALIVGQAIKIPFSYDTNTKITFKDSDKVSSSWVNMAQTVIDDGLMSLDEDGNFNPFRPLEMNPDQPNMKLKELREKNSK